MGRPPSAAAPLGLCFWSFYIIDIYGYSLYIPYIFHIYFLAMFHIFSLVCFLIYGVNRRQVLIAKPHLYCFPDFMPFIYLLRNFRVDSEAEWKVRGKMYSENVVFFRSVLFPIVQNDSIPTIGHSDIYLFLIPIINLAEEIKNKNDSFIECFCITCDRIYARVSPPAPLIPSFQPFLGGGWRRGWMGGCSAWKKCPKCMREKNVQNMCVKKVSTNVCVKNVHSV